MPTPTVSCWAGIELQVGPRSAGNKHSPLASLCDNKNVPHGIMFVYAFITCTLGACIWINSLLCGERGMEGGTW